jgi:hypothetical protein
MFVRAFHESGAGWPTTHRDKSMNVSAAAQVNASRLREKQQAQRSLREAMLCGASAPPPPPPHQEPSCQVVQGYIDLSAVKAPGRTGAHPNTNTATGSGHGVGFAWTANFSDGLVQVNVGPFAEVESIQLTPRANREWGGRTWVEEVTRTHDGDCHVRLGFEGCAGSENSGGALHGLYIAVSCCRQPTSSS